MAAFQETAYERLFTWVERTCSSGGDDASMALDGRFIRSALAVLRERPAYFTQCKRAIASLRRRRLAAQFSAAMTGSGQSAEDRPIAVHAHDPHRYVSDILAWVHVAFANERDLASLYYGLRDKAGAAQDEQSIASVKETLDMVFEGVVTPMSASVKAVIGTVTATGVAYKLTDLISFYSATFEGLLTAGKGLPLALRSCRDEASGKLTGLLDSMRNRLVTLPSGYPSDLGILTSTRDCLDRLDEMLQVHSSSLDSSSASPIGMSDVLTKLLDPLLTSCRLSGEGLDSIDLGVLMLNNISEIIVLLRGYSVADEWTVRLTGESDRWVQGAASDQATQVLTTCGMSAALRVVSSGDEEVRAAGIGCLHGNLTRV